VTIACPFSNLSLVLDVGSNVFVPTYKIMMIILKVNAQKELKEKIKKKNNVNFSFGV